MAKGDVRGVQKAQDRFYAREAARRAARRKALQRAIGLADSEVKQRGKHIANGRS